LTPLCEYIVGDLVMCRNYTGGDDRIQVVVTQKLSPVTYDLRLGDGRIWKRHVNQMIDCGLVNDKEGSTDLNVNLKQNETNEDKLEVAEELDKSVLVSQEDSVSTKEEDNDTSNKRPKRVIRPPNKLNL